MDCLKFCISSLLPIKCIASHTVGYEFIYEWQKENFNTEIQFFCTRFIPFTNMVCNATN